MTVRRTFAHRAALLLSCSAIASAILLNASPAHAQVTFGEIGGDVVLEDGKPAAGVEVEIVHQPSGTRSRAIVNGNGRFLVTGLRIGGPYIVIARGDGLDDDTVSDVYATAGSPVEVKLALRAKGSADVVVNAVRQVQYGTARRFDENDIQNTQVVERKLQEVIRRDPRAFVDLAEPDDDQGVSILGFNTRFNNIVVDGVSQIDSYGDNFTGLPTRRSPISLDAIASLTVETAPFDVQNSGFQGGQINILTKSGDNKFHGSAFYRRTGGFLSGTLSRPVFGETGQVVATDTVAQREPEDNWGVTLSGPIIKDKLFFTFSYEEFKQNELLGTCPTGIACDDPNELITNDQYETIRQASINTYGFDPGSFNDILNLPDGERKFLGKLDWNVTDGHRVAVTYQNTQSSSVGSSAPGGLASPSSYVSFTASQPVVLSAQYFADWSDRFSTQVRVGYTKTRRVSQPLFPAAGNIGLVQIQGFNANSFGQNGVTVSLGIDDDDQNTRFESERLQLLFRGSYKLGDHRLSFGYERDDRSIFDLDVPAGSGLFVFQDPDGVDNPNIAGVQGGPGTAFQQFLNRNVGFVTVAGPVSGNPLDAATNFTLVQDSFYLQDEWKPTNNLTLLFGLRYERLSTGDVPTLNPFFRARYGFTNQATLDGKEVFQPRFAFNYRPVQNTTVRGGVGVFAGGVPLAFFGETYQQTGISTFNTTVQGAAVNPLANFEQLPPAAIAGLGTSQSRLTEGTDSSTFFLDPNFEIPRNLRFQLAVDQRFDLPLLGNNWRFSAEIIHSEILKAIQFQDIRLQTIGTLPGLNVPRFAVVRTPLDTRPARPTNRSDGVAAPQDIAITNTSRGRTTVVSFNLDKRFDFKRWGTLDMNVGYAYTDARDVSPANDTDNLSDVFETGAFDNINNPSAAPSIQSIPHNLVHSFNYEKKFDSGVKFRFSMFGNYRAGRSVSFVLGNVGQATAGFQTIQPGLSDRAQDRLVPYLPTGPNDPLVRYGAGASYEELANIISAFNLQRFQGGQLPRNSIRAGSTYQLDLNAQIEIPSPVRGRWIIDVGIRNFLNLLDNRAGQINRYSIRETLYDAVFDTATNQYVITNIDDGNVPLTSEERISTGSVWRAQLGIRYQF